MEEQENAKSSVLQIQHRHKIEMARAEGMAEAEKCLSFLKRIEDGGSDADEDGGIGISGGPQRRLLRSCGTHSEEPRRSETSAQGLQQFISLLKTRIWCLSTRNKRSRTFTNKSNINKL